MLYKTTFVVMVVIVMVVAGAAGTDCKEILLQALAK